VAATTPEHGAAAGDTMWSNRSRGDDTNQDRLIAFEFVPVVASEASGPGPEHSPWRR
jgi:hypothetical protein